jgi:hypothetical protein
MSRGTPTCWEATNTIQTTAAPWHAVNIRLSPVTPPLLTALFAPGYWPLTMLTFPTPTPIERTRPTNKEQVPPHLAQLLCCPACVSAWRVHKGDDGQAKLVGVAHKAHGLAVAVGLGHAKVAADVLLQDKRGGLTQWLQSGYAMRSEARDV